MKLKPTAIKYSSFIYNKWRQNHSDLKSITDRNLGEEPGTFTYLKYARIDAFVKYTYVFFIVSGLMQSQYLLHQPTSIHPIFPMTFS